jgi:hypothetical protein
MVPQTRPAVLPARSPAAGATGAVRATLRPVSDLLRAARRGHPGLFWFAMMMGGPALAAVVGLIVDDRVLLGAPLWFKPLKFAASFGLYALTLAWMASLVRRGRRVVTVTGWVLVALSAIEIVVIVGQAARGVRSHFNDDTPFDALLFSVMGAAVAMIWLATAVLAVVVVRQRIADRVVAWSIGLGLLVALLGMGVGLLMTGQPGGGAHSVGVPDGGPGLPVVGWSTTGGDLRIGHFVGLHALQVIPLLGAVLAAVPRRVLPERAGLRLLGVGAAGHLGIVGVLVWQALRGQPLLAPDAATLVAAASLLGSLAVAAVLAVFTGRRAA